MNWHLPHAACHTVILDRENGKLRRSACGAQAVRVPLASTDCKPIQIRTRARLRRFIIYCVVALNASPRISFPRHRAYIKPIV